MTVGPLLTTAQYVMQRAKYRNRLGVRDASELFTVTLRVATLNCAAGAKSAIADCLVLSWGRAVPLIKLAISVR